MADYQAVALGIKPADPNQAFNSINSILGMQQKRQALQVQGQQLQQEQLATQEQQGLSNFFTQWSPGDHVGADGTTDLDSAHSSDAYKGLPGNARAAVDQKLIQIKQGQIQNASSLLGLTKEQLGFGSQLLGPLSQDKDVIAGSDDGKAKVQAALSQWGQLGGAAGAKVALTYQKMTDGDLKPGELPIRVQALMKQADTALLKQGSVSVGTGAATQFGTQDPLTGATTMSGPSVPNKIPPGYTMVNGQLVRADDTGLSVPPVRGGAPAAPAPATKLQAIPRPAVNAPPGDVARYNATMDENRKHTIDVSAAANDLQNGVGPTRYRNDQIQDILNSKTFSPTGPGAAQFNWIASKIPGSSGDAYQKIGHYLAQNSAAIAQKMGVPGTNMGAEQAAAAAGNTSQNKGALLEVTKVNDAMNTALDMYNRGLAKVSGNGADPSKVSAYRQAFGQSFDMNALRYDDALRRGDRKEVDQLKTTLGPTGLKALAQRRQVLHSLADTGDLP